MYENLCTLPLSSELFAQALHPKEALLAVGLSSGHVECFRLPSVDGARNGEEGNDDDDDDDDDDEGDRSSVLSNGKGLIETVWRTRRHKGSCRTVGWSGDGDGMLLFTLCPPLPPKNITWNANWIVYIVLYTSGTDTLLKAASSTTGQVTSKILLPKYNSSLDPPTLLHPLSPSTLLVATDSSALYLYDLRLPSILNPKPSQTHHPHDDYISSLTPLKPTEQSTSGFPKQWVTTGGTTLAVTDLRRGVLVKSEDQEEELLSSCYVEGLRRSKGKVIVGSGSGVLTLWERGIWDDQEERIIVDGRGKEGGESLDAIIVGGEEGKDLFVGVGDGTVRVVRLGQGGNKVTEVLRHDEIEGVLGVGFDVEGRLISGGGSVVKVWEENSTLRDEDDEDEEEEDSDDEEGEVGGMNMAGKRQASDDSDEADSSDEEQQNKRKKKRKKGGRGKGMDKLATNGILKIRGLE